MAQNGLAQIGFIGLGNMGLPMAQNLIKAGHPVCGYDLSSTALDRLSALGGISVRSLDVASMGVDLIANTIGFLSQTELRCGMQQAAYAFLW